LLLCACRFINEGAEGAVEIAGSLSIRHKGTSAIHCRQRGG
jgi:hypothetical protein